MVSLDEKSSLDYLLNQSKCPDSFDLLSIDIDGNDWWIWRSLNREPKVVIIEYNGNHRSSCVMPYDKNYAHANTTYYGATPPAMMLLANYKGYDLVGMNQVNMVFVRKNLNVLPRISIEGYPWFAKWANDTTMQMMRIDEKTDLSAVILKDCP